MDLRYMDFGEVEFTALHPTIQKRCEIRVWGGGGGGGGSSLAAYW